MLRSIIDAFKVPELRKKMLFTLAILALYRLGAYVPVPGIPFREFATAYQESGVAMSMLDLFTGGALSNFSVFSPQWGVGRRKARVGARKSRKQRVI